jgi:hypothetical protein
MISEGEREAQKEGKWAHCASEIDVGLSDEEYSHN